MVCDVNDVCDSELPVLARVTGYLMECTVLWFHNTQCPLLTVTGNDDSSLGKTFFGIEEKYADRRILYFENGVFKVFLICLDCNFASIMAIRGP